jgi:hypothetical protein
MKDPQPKQCKSHCRKDANYVARDKKSWENWPLDEKVFMSQNLFEVEMRKERLEAGIRCTIKNQRSSGLAGEIPFTEVFLELWVLKIRITIRHVSYKSIMRVGHDY